MVYVPTRAHCVDAYFANSSTFASTKWLFWSISCRDCSVPVYPSCDLAVSGGVVEVEIHPQFLGAGTFRSPGDVPPKSGKRLRLFDGKTITGWAGDTQRTWRI